MVVESTFPILDPISAHVLDIVHRSLDLFCLFFVELMSMDTALSQSQQFRIRKLLPKTKDTLYLLNGWYTCSRSRRNEKLKLKTVEETFRESGLGWSAFVKTHPAFYDPNFSLDFLESWCEGNDKKIAVRLEQIRNALSHQTNLVYMVKDGKKVARWKFRQAQLFAGDLISMADKLLDDAGHAPSSELRDRYNDLKDLLNEYKTKFPHVMSRRYRIRMSNHRRGMLLSIQKLLATFTSDLSNDNYELDENYAILSILLKYLKDPQEQGKGKEKSVLVSLPEQLWSEDPVYGGRFYSEEFCKELQASEDGFFGWEDIAIDNFKDCQNEEENVVEDAWWNAKKAEIEKEKKEPWEEGGKGRRGGKGKKGKGRKHG